MKILFLTGCINQIGGIERVTLDIAGHLADEGFEISILSFAKNPNAQESFSIHPKIRTEYILNKWKHICFAPFYAARFRKAVKKINPDVIVYVDTMLFIFIDPFLKGVCRNAKKIAWEHFSWILSKGKKRIRPISRKMAVRKSDAVVLLTEEDKQYLENYTTKKRAKLLVIPNVVRTDLIGKRDLKPVLNRPKHVLFIGRLARQKQVPELIDIWNRIEERHPDWKLIIVGDGVERGLVEEKIQNYGLKNVQLEGKQREIHSYCENSQILLLTSRFEGLPLVLIEGQQFGLTEISFDCPCGPKEIIENGRNGYIIDNFDKNAFAQKLSELMEKDDLRKQFSERSLELSKNYLPEKIIPQWIDLFQGFK